MIPAPPNMGDVARVMLIGVGKPKAAIAAARRIAAAWSSPRSMRSASRTRRSSSTPSRARHGARRGQSRLWRAAALLSLRQVPHQGEARAEADAEGADLHGRRCRGARRSAFEPLDKIADGVFFTRDLVSEPANVIYPETLAAAGEEARRARRRGRGAGREADEEARHGRAARRRPGQRAAAARSSSCSGRAMPRPRTRRRSPSSARASPSTPAASRSSRPAAWRT